LEHLPKDRQQQVCVEVGRVLKENGVLVISVPYRENIMYTRCVHCGRWTPLWGHLASMDLDKVNVLLPNFALLESYHLPNAPLVTLSGLFESFPSTVWFALNSLAGCVRKGYWLVMKYKKSV
jgi:hypothetical protein